MLYGKTMPIQWIAGMTERLSLYKMTYYPQSNSLSKNKIKVELDLANCSTQSEVKKSLGADASKFAKNIDLVSSKWYWYVKNFSNWK